MNNELSTSMYVRVHRTKIKFKCTTCLREIIDTQDCVALKLLSPKEDIKVSNKKCAHCDTTMSIENIKDA
jgi:hypothetical protein